MSNVICNTEQVARKQYPCDGIYFIKESGVDLKAVLSPEHLTIIEKAIADPFIKKGDVYFAQVQDDGGRFIKFRARKDVADILMEYRDTFYDD